jgi:hypothetical protein
MLFSFFSTAIHITDKQYKKKTCTDSLPLKKTTYKCTITKNENNINMDSTIAGPMNARS